MLRVVQYVCARKVDTIRSVVQVSLLHHITKHNRLTAQHRSERCAAEMLASPPTGLPECWLEKWSEERHNIILLQQRGAAHQATERWVASRGSARSTI